MKNTLLGEGQVLSSPYYNDWIYLFENIEIHGSIYNYHERLYINHVHKLNETEKAHIEEIKPFIKERAEAALKKMRNYEPRQPNT